ncbi:MAG: TonB-dependent receptor [Flavobacteriales bacterium]|nr:TonB-dependent receptor [Flavobacteriales bacterium]MDW8431263.1 TonB-dependent receptor [Flavobacteriales bacterium]
MQKPHIFFFIVLWLTGHSSTHAQVRVLNARDSGPVSGASGYIHEAGVTLRADSMGLITWSGLKPGVFHMHVFAPGFRSAVFTFSVPKTGEDTVWLMPSQMDLMPVTVEESRSRLTPDAHPQPVTVVEQEFIVTSGQSTLAGALATLPGIQTLTTGTAIAKPLIRGLGFNRVAVFDHGIRQEGQQWGADHGLEIDGPGVERVEIIKGPGALLYGGDAIAGVISLQPTHELQEGILKWRNTAAWRSVNNGWQYASYGKIFLRPVLVSGGFSGQDFGDFRVPASDFVYNGFRYPLAGGRVLNTAGREKNARFSLGLHRPWGFVSVYGSYYHLKAGFFSGAHGIPSPADLLDDGKPRDIRYPYQDIRHLKVIHNGNVRAGRHYVAWDVGFQNNLRQELSLPHNHGIPVSAAGNVEHLFRLITVSGQARFHQNISRRLDGIHAISGQFRHNKIGGFEFLIPDFRDWEAAISSLLKWKASGAVFVTAGLRGDVGRLFSEPYYRQMYDNGLPSYLERAAPQLRRRFFNLSGATGLRFSPGNGHHARLHLGSSFRMPTVAELTVNGMHHGTFRHEKGDSTLRPERSLQLDVGYEWNTEKVTLNLSGFCNYFIGFIYLNPTAQFSPLPEAGIIWQYEQADGLHTGLEWHLDYHPVSAWHLEFLGQGIYTLNPRTGYSFPLMPPASAAIRTEYQMKGWGQTFRMTPGAEIRSALPQWLYARNEMFTPGYILLHIYLRTEFKFSQGVASLMLRADNLFNARYFNHLSMWRYLGLPEPGRNFQVLLNLPLEIPMRKKKPK